MTSPGAVAYVNSASNVKAEQLTGFITNWTTMPSPEALLRILLGSSHVVLAVQVTTGRVVGLVAAISDNESAAYISHLEMLPE